MKKLLLISTAFLALAMSACGGSNPSSEAPQSSAAPSSEPAPESSVAPSSEPAPESSVAPSSALPPSSAASSSEEPVEIVNQYVVGSFNGWTQQDSDYLMTVDPEDSNHFTFEELPLEAGDALKTISENGVWHPDGMGNDTKAEEDGIYTVHLHLDYPKATMTTIEKTGEYIPPVVEKVYYVVGDFNDWTVTEGYELVQDSEDENHYVYAEVTVSALDKLKVTDQEMKRWYGTSAGGDVVLGEAGVYQVDFYLEPEEGHDPVVATLIRGEGPSEFSFYVTGDFNDWGVDEDYLMTIDSEDANHYFFNDLVTETEGLELKVCDADQNIWFGDLSASGNVLVEIPGTYRVDLYIQVEAGNPNVTVTPANA